ncbi:hypothetical protein D3C71_1861770 [compost metagenome]
MGGNHVEKDPHRGIGDAAKLEFVLAHQADGLAERGIDFGDQGQAEGVHVGKMPIEASRNDTCGFRHFTQADTAETAATLHQLAGGV